MKEIIPRTGRLTRRNSLLMQEFGHLWTRMSSSLPHDRASKVGFCSGSPGEGASSIATNYAIFLAQHGVRTTLIDANMRRPSLARHFGVRLDPGLWDVLEGTVALDEVIHDQVVPCLNLITSGDAPPDVLVGGTNFDLRPVFEQLERHNDMVVVDVPALGSSPEANLILPQLDGTVLVVQSSRNRVCSLERTVKNLDYLRINLLGCVLNKLRYDLPSALDKMV
ncbi:MAG: CpsD/CapB family tyrosine-protein kinase [Planctomycetes bacterium]|nr:CpsD/CapB family tyrosine-protein kinase [Planctomycetota bacterium]MCB9889938.1 CpsD/CapB family tyrosine-protein kinase [Planctomycetota bacterium]